MINKRSLALSFVLTIGACGNLAVSAQTTATPAPGSPQGLGSPTGLPGTLPGLGLPTAPSALPTIGSPSTGTGSNTPGSLPPVTAPAGTSVPFGTQPSTGATNTSVPSTPSTTPGAMPAATSGSPAAPNGALSPATAGAPNTTVLDFNAQNPPIPLMGTITQEVAFTIDKQKVQRGPFAGLVLHLHNGTNSPLMFDGNRARIRVGDACIDATSDLRLEEVTAPPPSGKHEAKMFFANAVTVGLYSTVQDEKVERGPVLPRYGSDQLRREASLERFGTRILWPGDDTQGIVFFNTTANIDQPGSKLELPVVSFPDMQVRGYLTGMR